MTEMNFWQNSIPFIGMYTALPVRLKLTILYGSSCSCFKYTYQKIVGQKVFNFQPPKEA